ncbi:MAG: murein biosynthesis integral membrane protein MurJ [Thermoflexales bacterium]|nr:murein biosynthesis integral membrane protein MurJ [Thermoflexales bacterium]
MAPLSSDLAARRVARAATLTSIGNLSSRIVGFVAVAVRAYFFGNSRAASAFELAANIPTLFNDLLAGRMLSSALVPTFTGLATEGEGDGDGAGSAARGDLREYGRLLGALLGLGAAGLTALVAILLLMAGPLAGLITAGQNQDLGQVAALLRITIPAILFMNLGAVITAALQARHRFEYTAFTATAFNVVMIACTFLFQASLGVEALAIGMLLGSAVQALMQLPGLRGVPIRFSLDWRLPGIRRVVALFLPVAGGLVLAQFAAQLSFTLANVISPEGPTTMRYAAQVIQFPLGLVSAAISAAILPTLSAQTSGARQDFKATLGRGLGLVIALTAPAAAGLFVLAHPVVALLFQRGEFTAASAAYTALSLRAAVPNLLFSAIDGPLIFAFYAMRDTRTPTIVGLASTLFYLVLVGLGMALSASGARAFSLSDLVLCDSLKTGFDALLMGTLLARRLGGLGGRSLLPLSIKAALATLGMALVALLAQDVLAARLAADTFASRAILVAGVGLIGALAYLGLAWALGMRDLVGLVPRRLRRSEVRAE